MTARNEQMMPDTNSTEGRISSLEANQRSMLDGLNQLGTAVKDINRKLDTMNRTDWGTIFGGLGVLALVVGFLWAVGFNPITQSQADERKFIENIADRIARLETKSAKSESDDASIDRAITYGDQLSFLRLAYEHEFVQMLWKSEYGSELPAIPPHMPIANDIIKGGR